MALAGRVAFVTGGASGLGLATVHRFVEQGAKVIFCDLQSKTEKGDEIASQLGRESAAFVPADIMSEDDVQTALDFAESKFGRVDVNVNCAGIGVSILTYNPKKDNPEARYHSLDLFKRLVNTNLIGTFNVIRLVAMRMKDNVDDLNGEKGVIVNSTSISAFEGQRGQVAFGASTGGVNGMTKPISAELALNGIRLNTIAPGYFYTPLLGNIPQKVKTFLESTVPNPPRLGKPEEFAHLAESIILNPCIRGQIVRIDGAIRLHP